VTRSTLFFPGLQLSRDEGLHRINSPIMRQNAFRRTVARRAGASAVGCDLADAGQSPRQFVASSVDGTATSLQQFAPSAWQRLGTCLRREELNLVLRGQRHHFRRISEAVDFFK
jgi:hypothetical protein